MKLSQLIRSDAQFQPILSCIREQHSMQKPLPVIINGLTGGAEESFLIETISELIQKEKEPLVILAPNATLASRYQNLFSEIGINSLLFQERNLIFYEYSASHDLERERLFVLYSLLENKVDVIITTPAALTSYTIPKNRLSSSYLSLRPGKIQDLDDLCEKLLSFGYERTTLVEGAGQFARRGGIVDLWSTSSLHPLRLEFFDDEIDRMCFFDVFSQRVLEVCDEFLLLPAEEVLLDDLARKRIEKHLLSLKPNDVGEEERKRELEHLQNREPLLSRDRFLSLIYPEKETLLDYLSSKNYIFFLGTNEVTESLHTYHAHLKEERESYLEQKLLTNDLSFELSEKEFQSSLERYTCIHLNPFMGSSFSKEGGLFGFRCRRLPTYVDSPKALQDDLFAYKKERYSMILVCETQGEATSLASYYQDLGFSVSFAKEELSYTDLIPGVLYLTTGTIFSGYELVSSRIAVLSMLHDDMEANKRKLKQKKHKNYKPGQVLSSYNELHEGDVVVHEKYGIGRFLGMKSITQNNITKDYISIQYAGSDRLFVPAEQLAFVTKYIGASDETGEIKLSKMGTQTWTKEKSRAKAAAKEMAHELIQLYAARQRRPGISFQSDLAMENEFDGNFDYDLTSSQEQSVKEIKADMEKPVPMDRLLCGDVGYGKTEVAIRAAFRAVLNGYQVAILAPTTILAMQHFETISARMRGFAVQVDLISRFRTGKEREAIIRRVARGETDIIVGTHALLSSAISFKKLGLLIIDEEQRFGVAQKEKIKQIAQDVDVLTLTATPIPRTLNMAMSGIRDLSILDEAPEERKPVQTYVMQYSEPVIFTAIRRELARFGQVLYLYNNTENIDIIAGRIQDSFPGARVAYGHGKMDKEELEEIWRRLVMGEIDILVCTTIIETGVDLPNANTLIIENADRMGLSQLHQIRGRIGRSSRQAYAYFTYRAGKTLTPIAYKRLCAIRDFAEFGAGFRIAMRDLEIRGAGDLLGASQHGHINVIGYDLYMKLLEEAVLEEQGKAKDIPFESTIIAHADANIPESYIDSSLYRLEMYKKITLISKKEDLEDVLDELCDRFGEPPKQTLRLLYISLSRAIASRLQMTSVEVLQKDIKLYPKKPEIEIWTELFYTFKGFRIPSSSSPYLYIQLEPKVDPVRSMCHILLTYEETKNKLKGEQESETTKNNS